MSNFADSESRPSLSIGDLAKRSGMPAATLRTWEARYGFPVATRLAGGHRRYSDRDVELLGDIARLRDTGLSVAAAIAAARRAGAPSARSFFAHLRSQNPKLRSQVLTKRVLLALTWAVEDEYCARAAKPLLFATFQREAMYRRSELRWLELARTAQHTAVFADFERLERSQVGLVEVPLPVDGPVRREWTLVCDDPDFPACVAGWELPTSTRLPDAERLFETIWTLDPRIVREASRVGLALLDDATPNLAQHLVAQLPDVGLPASPDLENATTLFARTLSYAQHALAAPQAATGR